MLFLIMFNLMISTGFAELVCECEDVRCGMCEQASQIVFYNLNCTESKTCAKPRCEKRSCTSALSEPVRVGDLAYGQGDVQIYRLENGAITKFTSVRPPFPIYMNDVVEVRTGHAQIRLADQSEVLATSGTRFEFAKLTAQLVKIELAYGQLRTQLKGESLLEVVSAAGTLRSLAPSSDAVISYRDLKWEVAVASGSMEVSSRKAERTLRLKNQQQVAYTLVGSAGEGWFSTIHEMTKELPPFESARAPASVEIAEKRTICGDPQGEMNQCAWSCEGNPKGSKKCRLDKSDVFCVRRRCNANGQWADESRLSLKSALQRCQSPTVQVGVCDY